jgi:hypothetical protein
MRAVVEDTLRRLGMRAPVVVTTVPNGVEGAGVGGSQAIVYYCVDDFTNWPGVDAGVARHMEAELLEVAAGVIATSAHLAATRRPRRGLTEVLPARRRRRALRPRQRPRDRALSPG